MQCETFWGISCLPDVNLSISFPSFLPSSLPSFFASSLPFFLWSVILEKFRNQVKDAVLWFIRIWSGWDTSTFVRVYSFNIFVQRTIQIPYLSIQNFIHLVINQAHSLNYSDSPGLGNWSPLCSRNNHAPFVSFLHLSRADHLTSTHTHSQFFTCRLSCIGKWVLYHWPTREALYPP